jgi:hypothetical protein
MFIKSTKGLFKHILTRSHDFEMIDIIFFVWINYTNRHFSGYFSGASKKSWPPRNILVVCPQKNNIPHVQNKWYINSLKI